MANSNYQKTKTNPRANTAHVNAIMHSTSSIENEKSSCIMDDHTVYCRIFYTTARKYMEMQSQLWVR
jgi:uncharacterized protein YtpQ (UPF0354 family)